MIEELNGDFLQWLRGFYYVAQTGSIRGAAAMMHKNPSTISYQLRSLERELNTVLFDRYNKGLQITPEGRRLLEWTITTFEILGSMRAEVGASTGTLQGTVMFSSSMSIGAQTVPAVSAFRKSYPRVNIKIRKALAAGVVEDVESSRVDFGLIGVTALPAGCEFQELFQARPMLVVGTPNTYDLPRNPGQEDLKRLPYVYFLSEQMDEVGDPFLGGTLTTPFLQNLALGVNNFQLMLAYVAQGVGVALMDESCLQANMRPQWESLTAYPLDAFFPMVRYGILIRKHKHLSPQARKLMDMLRDHLQ